MTNPRPPLHTELITAQHGWVNDEAWCGGDVTLRRCGEPEPNGPALDLWCERCQRWIPEREVTIPGPYAVVLDA